MLAVLLRLAPVLVLASAAAFLGYDQLSLIPARARSFLLIAFLVLFLIMTILDQEPGWNIVLLLGFSISAGMLLNWSDAEAARWGTWLAFFGLTGSALTGSVVFGKALRKGMRYLLPLTAFYILVWMGMIFWDLPPWVRGSLILSGLVLFTVFTAGTLQRGYSLKKDESPIPLSIKLWVILFNLFWLTGLIP